MRPNPTESSTQFLARFDQVRQTANMDSKEFDFVLFEHILPLLPTSQVIRVISALDARKRCVIDMADALAAVDAITEEQKNIMITTLTEGLLSFDGVRRSVAIAEEMETGEQMHERAEEEKDEKWLKFDELVKAILKSRNVEAATIDTATRTQCEDTVIDRAGKLRRGECFKCGVKGHISRFCQTIRL